MQRWHREFKIQQREWKKHRQSHVESNKLDSARRVGLSPQVIQCACDEQVGRFRKMDAWDCGIVHCWVCHNDKYPKRSKTRQEVLADVVFKEQLRA